MMIQRQIERNFVRLEVKSKMLVKIEIINFMINLLRIRKIH